MTQSGPRRPFYSPLIFAALMISRHLSISALCNCAKCLGNRRLFHPLESDFARSAGRAGRSSKLEIVAGESDDGSRLFGPGPIRVRAGLDLIIDRLRCRVICISAEMREASFHGGLVFRSRSLYTVVRRKFGNVAVDKHGRVPAMSIENCDSGSPWTQQINSAAVRADVDIC